MSRCLLGILMKIGLFYGSTTCYTEMAAEKIQAAINEFLAAEVVSIHNIKDEPLSNSEAFDFIIYGISTWDFGELQEDWESHWDDISKLQLSDKIVALYGMGDQLGYSEWFQDALGMLHDAVVEVGAKVIGFWPNQGYDFIGSKALTEDGSHFVGLALDDEGQYDRTDERIAQWVEQIISEWHSQL